MSTPIPQNLAVFSSAELGLATSGRLARRGASDGAGVATDTRAALDGKIFVALRGERFDGHHFLQLAVTRGARVLVVEDGPELSAFLATEPDVSVLVVADTLVALGDLALFHRRRWGKRLVAIGGSAGKTTTRSVVSALFDAISRGRVLSTQGNLNNRIGVPMMLLGLGPEHDLCVLELGTNRHGEMAELCRICRPDVGVLTLIDLEHTECLGDLDGVEREEGALLSSLPSSGIAIGFSGDVRVQRCLDATRAPRRLGYALSGEGFAVLKKRSASASGGTRLEVQVGDRRLSFTTSLLGRPGALAVLAGLSVVEALLPGRLDESTAARALAEVGEPGRSTLVRLDGGVLVLDDTYNSNPASVENSVATGEELARETGGKLHLVLGEMLELGNLSTRAHEAMGEVAARSGARSFVGVQGQAALAVERARALGLESVFVESAEAVFSVLDGRLAPGDVVVVKASRGVRAERVVADLRAAIGPAAQVSATSPSADAS